MGILLELIKTPSLPIEADCVNPIITKLDSSAIARLKLWQGRYEVELGEFFSVRRTDTIDADELHVEGDLTRVKYIGRNMSAGRMIVRGSCGMHTCQGMKGGYAEIHGNVDNWSFCQMQGGVARIYGNAGAFLGAAFPGDVRGMKGGTIWVQGNVGTRAVERMRRGMLIAGGVLGEMCAVEMIAGTVISTGLLKERAGAGMKRGTILAMGEREALLPGFERACCYSPTFVGILGRQLAQCGFIDDAGPFVAAGRRFTRWCGDLASLGKGEILSNE